MDSVEMHRQVFLARPSIRPVQADESWISSSFSRSRFHPVLQVNRPHPGLDISALAGTPILATAGGVVSYAGTRQGYGKTVEIDHGYSYKTRYAHAGSIQVKRGERVRRGGAAARRPGRTSSCSMNPSSTSSWWDAARRS